MEKRGSKIGKAGTRERRGGGELSETGTEAGERPSARVTGKTGTHKQKQEAEGLSRAEQERREEKEGPVTASPTSSLVLPLARPQPQTVLLRGGPHPSFTPHPTVPTAPSPPLHPLVARPAPA